MAGCIAPARKMLEVMCRHWHDPDFQRCELALVRIWDVGDSDIEELRHGTSSAGSTSGHGERIVALSNSATAGMRRAICGSREIGTVGAIAKRGPSVGTRSIQEAQRAESQPKTIRSPIEMTLYKWRSFSES